MIVQQRHQWIVLILGLLILSDFANTQTTNFCPTAIWNNTFNVIAGISGLASSGATTFNGPHDLAFGPGNTMFVADYYNNRVQRFVGGSMTATTVPNLTINYPSSIHVDGNGVLFVLDLLNYRVLRWFNNVAILAAAGRGAGSSLSQISTSYGLAVDSNSNIYVSDCGNNRVTFWTAGNPNISVVVAGGNGAGSGTHQLNCPFGIYVDNSSVLYICDANNNRIQRWLPGAVVGTTVAGTSGVSGVWSYLFDGPAYITGDQYGFLYIVDAANKRVQKWFPGARYGTTVVAASSMNLPRGMRFDPSGNLVLADHNMHRILSFGLICTPNATTTMAPTRQPATPVCPTAAWNQTFTVRAGSSGNAGATSTTLNQPHNIDIDIYGNLFVADCTNHRIQKFLPGTMFGRTVAGITSSNGASLSQLSSPTAVRIDTSGVQFILDWTNCRVMKWIEGEPMGAVVAGGNGCGGSLTQIHNSYGMFVDNESSIYISDYRIHRVVQWSPTNLTSGVLVAGGNGVGSSADRLNYPWGIYVDSNQNVYVVDSSNHRVQYWPLGSVTGTTVAGTTGSAGPWAFQLSSPTDITMDPYGFIYIMDTGNNRVQRWVPGATFGTTMLSASMNLPYGLKFDNRGNMLIADVNNHRVLFFGLTCPASTTTTTPPPSTPLTALCPTATWNTTVNVIAGITSSAGSTQTLLSSPYNMYFDGYQNLFVADTSNHRIQMFSAGSFTGTTIAGRSGTAGSSISELYSPSAVYVDGNSNMYILDTTNYRVLRWRIGEPLGYVVAGGNSAGASLTQISTSYGMFVDSQLNIYVSDAGNDRVTKWLATNRTSGILVAGGNGAGSTPQRLNNPWGIYVHSNQAVFICDRNNHRIQRWDAGTITGVTVAGTTGTSGVWSYLLNGPTAIILDATGFMCILDAGNARIMRWWPGASFGTILLATSFSGPVGLQLDRGNNLVVADTGNHRIVSFGLLCPPATTTTTPPPTLTTSQICSTAIWNQVFTLLAGSSGNAGSSSLLLSSPYNNDFDGYRNLYVADSSNNRIQMFASGSFTATTIAGTGTAGAALSQLNNPTDIYLDPNRNMYILDTNNYRVMRWKVGEPMGFIVAGGNSWGAALTQITTSYAIFVDNQRNVYVSESGNHRVTMWSASNTTAGVLVAGGNGAGNAADRLNSPWGIYVDANGTLFIVDRGNHRVQRWLPGAINGMTVAGSTSDPGPYAYQFSNPTGITLDQFGFMYILDMSNNRVQRWTAGATFGITVVAASMSSPTGLRVGPTGDLIVTDSANHRVLSFAISCPASTTSTAVPPTLATVPVCPTAVWNQTFGILAGSTSNPGSTTTLLSSPSDIGFDGYRNMYVVDTDNHRIQRFPPGSNVGTTIAGVSGTAGARRSELSSPYAIRVTTNGTMFILDTNNYRVLRWQVGDPLSFVVAGGNGYGSTLDRLGTAYGFFVDNQFNVYISDSTFDRVVVWRVTNMTAGQIVAGGNGAGNSADKLNAPWGVFVDTSNSVFVVDRTNHRVQRWSAGATSGVTVAGSTSDPGPWSYQFSSPTAITFDPQGFMYVLDFTNDRVQRWWPGATFGTTVAAAVLSSPRGMQFDRLGNIVITDTAVHRVISFGIQCPAATTTTALPPTQAVVPLCPTAVWNQTFTSLVGAQGTAGSTPTLLSSPYDVAFDGYRNMYVADRINNRIQRFSPGSNVGTTIAGFSLGSGASRSELYYPSALSVTPNGTMFIIDDYNFRVLKWQGGDQLGYVVAGGRGLGSTFDRMGYSYGISVDDQYNIYISEQSNHRVTLWMNGNTTSGRLVAGGNGVGSTSDKLSSPWGVYVDVNGTIFVSDRGNHRIQRWGVGAATGVTIAGSTADPGPWSYQLSSPTAITFDQYGFIYILDYSNNRVQKWLPGASFGTTVAAASMNTPIGLRMDRLGNIVVCDTSNHRVISFGLLCPASTTTTTAPPIPTTVPLCATAVWNQTFSIVAGATSNAGSTSTLLSSPYDVSFDGYRNMYVADFTNNRIQQFPAGSSTATTVAGFSLSAGSSRSEFNNPTAISVTPNGTMFILDRDNYRVLRWQLGDTFGTVIAGGRGLGALFTQMGTCYSIYVDNQYNVYVSENSNNRVTVWFNGNTTSGRLVAGGNGAGNSADKLNSPWGVYVDSTNAIFIVDRSNHRVQRWASGAATGTTVAGSTSDPGPWAYQLNSPTAIFLDSFGFIYVLDFTNDRIQKWWPGATFGTTVAAATMVNPYGLKLDPIGNMYVADTSQHRILKFGLACPAPTTTTAAPPTQPIIPLCATAVWNQTFTIVAGATSTSGNTATLLNAPFDISFDVYQNMYIADYYNNRIQRYPRGSNTGTTIAGFNLSPGSSRSELYYPSAITITGNGTMFILDDYNHRVLRWQVGDQLGFIVAGGNGLGAAFTQMGYSAGIFVDNQLNIYLSENSNHRITMWSASNTTAGQLVAGGNGAGSTLDRFNTPWGIFVEGNNTIYVADRDNHRVQRWIARATSGVTVAGSSADPGPWSYQFNTPTGLTMDRFGFLYVMDSNNGRIQKWWPGASFGTTVAAATMSSPRSLGMDRLGNLYAVDTNNHRVLQFGLTCPAATTTTPSPSTQARTPVCPTATWSSTFTTLAGAQGNAGSTSTLFSSPYDATFDSYGFMYVADFNNHRIQRFSPGSNTGSTVAGFNLASGSSRSELYTPAAITVDANGQMFILDSFNYRVLKWQLGDPLGVVIAGGRGLGSTFDRLARSYGLFVDSQSNVYVSDYGNNRVTRWMNGNTTAGMLVAGGNGVGNSADKLNSPWGVYVDSTNAVFVVDRANHRVQKWNAGAATGTTVAGSTSDPGPWSFQFNNPTAIIFDPQGFMYVLDLTNDRVQKWWPGAPFGQTVISSTVMSSPIGMQFDLLGNIVIADTSNHRILSFPVTCPPTTTTTVAPPTQSIVQVCSSAVWNQMFSTEAGSMGTTGLTGTLLNSPYDVGFDAYQNMYVVDASNHRIQFFPQGSSMGSTIAGNSGVAGASRSELNFPVAIKLVDISTMYILDLNNFRVLRWQLNEPLGYVVAGGRGSGTTFDRMGSSYDLFIDSQYNIYISETGNNRVTRWAAGNTTAGMLVAGGNGAGNSADKLNGPWGIFVDSSNAVFVVDRNNHRVQRWASGANIGQTVAGTTGDNGPWSYQLNNPTSITTDQFGFLYILDFSNQRVQRWTQGATFGTTIVAAPLSSPYGMDFDRVGNIYIADTSNHRVLSFSMTCPPWATPTPAPSTLATTTLCQTATWSSTFIQIAGGTSFAGSAAHLFSSPYDITVDIYGNVYVADFNNNRIQRFPPGSNTGTTIAGFTLGSGASRSELYNPAAIIVDSLGQMYIADSFNYRVFRWQIGEPMGTVIAGGRGLGSTLDRMGRCYGLFLDPLSNIYVSDNGNNRVTRWFNGNTTAGVLVAGGNGVGNSADKLNSPWGIYVDLSYAVFVADRANHRVQRWPFSAATGVTVAGSTSDPGPFAYQLNNPTAISLDPYGFLFVLDAGNARIQKWWPGASFGVTVLAASMSTPLGMRLDATGRLYIADTGFQRILSFAVQCPPTTTATALPPVPTTTPMCPTTVWNQNASLVTGSSSGAGATATFVSSPSDVAFDGYGNLYVADTGNHRIQQYPPGSNAGTTVAGVTSVAGISRAELSSPSGIRFDSLGAMYILDTNNYRVLRWPLGDTFGTVVVNGRGAGSTLDRIGVSYALCLDNQNNIYVSESGNHRVTKWIAGNNTIGQLVAGVSVAGSTSDRLNSPRGIYVDASYVLFITDRSNHRIQRWLPGAAVGTTIAGESTVAGSWSYQLNSPASITFDQYGFMYILDAGNLRIQKWLPGMTYGVTVASGSMNNPTAINFDLSSNIVIADTSNQRIIAFNAFCANPTTVTAPPPTLPSNSACQTATYNTSWIVAAGTSPTAGSTAAFLNTPMDVYVDGNQNIFVADFVNSRIQKFPPAGTTIGSPMGTTVAGFTLAGGATYSELNDPTAIFVHPNGTMYIADSFNYRVQRWVRNEPLGFTVAGGRGNGATFDRVGMVYAIYVDDPGNIYVSEFSNNRVTFWTAGNNTVGRLVAGTGTMGTALNTLNAPLGVHVDSSGAIYIADRGNHRIVRWNQGASTGVLIAGTTGTSGATSTLLNSPTAIALDTLNFLYVMDAGNNRVQRFASGSTVGETVAAIAFNSPRGMRVDSIGNIYVADTNSHRIILFRCVYNASTTTITTTTTTSQSTTSFTTTTTTSTSTTSIASTTSTSTTSMFVPTTTTSTTTATGSTSPLTSTTTVSTTTTSTTTVATTTGSTSIVTTSVTTVGTTVTTTTTASTTTISTTTGTGTTTSGVVATTITTTAAVTTTTVATGTTTTVAPGTTTTGAGATTTTTVAGTTTTGAGPTTTTTTVAPGTTTTGAGATTITTTTAGVTTTAATATTTTVAGVTTTTTTVAGVTTATTGGVVVTTTTTGGGGGGTTAGSTAGTAAPAAGTTTAASSLDSSSIGAIAGGAIGGALGLAALIAGGKQLYDKFKGGSSSKSSSSGGGGGGDKAAFKKVNNVKPSSNSNQPVNARSAPESTPRGKPTPDSTSNSTARAKPTPDSASNSTANPKPRPEIESVNQEPDQPIPDKMNVNSRSYDIHIINNK